MLDLLTRFTVIPEYHRARTLYHVHVKGTREPVAQARIERAPDTLHPLEVFTGPGLDQPAGWVSFGYALAPDRTRLGNVGGRRGTIGRDKWTFAQNGLPVLHGARAGVAGTLRDSLPVVRDFLTGGVADMALSAHLKFSAPDCVGFEFTRQPGIKTRYTVRIHDARVNWLLVIAAILRFDRFDNPDVRRGISETIANPFKI
jgi:hypothetical protein